MRLVRDKYFKEATTSNIYKRLNDNTTCAIISPYRSENSDYENKRKMNELKSDVRALKLGFNQFISRWVEDGIAYDEQSLLVPNITEKQAIKLGKKYNQSSIIFKDDKSCREICTTPFETYKEGDIVRTFYNVGEHILNIDDAQEIFSKRRGGPVSMPIKGSNKKPFTPKPVVEVYELEQPKPSYFQTEYRGTRIL